MALHLHFAPDSLRLIPVFQRALDEAWNDPMIPPSVLVAHPALRNLLQRRICKEKAVVANLNINTLERFLWETLKPDSNNQMLHSAHLAQKIYVFLHDLCLNPQDSRQKGFEFEPVLQYLMQDNSQADPQRILQLSMQIATLFSEYEYNRPRVWDSTKKEWKPGTGMDNAWLQNSSSSFFFKQNQSPADLTEAWQRRLYQAVFGLHPESPGLQQQNDSGELKIFRTLPQLYVTRHNQDRTWMPAFHTPVFLYNISKISHFHRNLLLELSENTELHVFLTNPCAEFWEDVQTSRGRSNHQLHYRSAQVPPLPRFGPAQYNAESLRDGLPDFAQFEEQDNRLLQLWGQTGKENIALWCQAADYDFHWHGDHHQLNPALDNPAPTLLKIIQKALLERTPLHEALTQSGTIYNFAQKSDQHSNHYSIKSSYHDTSLQVLCAPSYVREMEALRDHIFLLLENDPQLSLDDIVLYVTDIKSYSPYIQFAFESYGFDDPRHIPFSVMGNSMENSLTGQAVSALLNIWEGDFSRGAVFAFLRNPLIYTHLRLSWDNVQTLESWAAKMGVYRDYNGHHRKISGIAPASCGDEQSFAWGMARLMVGGLAAGPVDLGFVDAEQSVLPVQAWRDPETSNTSLILKFQQTVDSLYQQFLAFKDMGISQSGLSLTEQWNTVCNWMDSWIVPDSRQSIYSYETEQRCRNALRSAMDLVPLQHSLGGRTDLLKHDEILLQIRHALPAEIPTAGSGWKGRLTIAPLRSAHITGHKHILLAGLESGLFPGSRRAQNLNLLKRKRIIGDPDAVNDNRYAFLELLQSAQTSLTLSYRSRNIQKDAAILPSSVLLELKAELKAAGVELKEQNIPLLRREQRDIWDEHELELAKIQSGPETISALQQSDDSLDKDWEEELQDDWEEETEDLTLSGFSLRHIQDYLNNPWEFRLKYYFGWSDGEEENALHISDEPLELSRLQQSILQRELLVQMVRTWPEGIVAVQNRDSSSENSGVPDFPENPDHSELIDNLWKKMRREGQMPSIVFSHRLRKNLENSVLFISKTLEALTQKSWIEGFSPEHSCLIENQTWSIGAKSSWHLHGTTEIALHFKSYETGIRDQVVLFQAKTIQSEKDYAKMIPLWLQGICYSIWNPDVQVKLCWINPESEVFVDKILLSRPEEYNIWIHSVIQTIREAKDWEYLPLQPLGKKLDKILTSTEGWIDDLREASHPRDPGDPNDKSYGLFMEDADLADPALILQEDEILQLLQTRLAVPLRDLTGNPLLLREDS